MIKRLIVVALLSSLLTACVTYRLKAGWPATDLSWLTTGTSREVVDERLGKPLEVDSSERGIIVSYEYDRGFLPPDTDMDWLVLPSMLFFEVGTMGMNSFLVEVADQCQRGLLRVMYDASDKTIAARECVGMADAEDCSHIRSRRRPSNLSENWEADALEELQCR